MMSGVHSFRSIKHYFLLDQGDFIVQFMDTADDELKKTMEGELIYFIQRLFSNFGYIKTKKRVNF